MHGMDDPIHALQATVERKSARQIPKNQQHAFTAAVYMCQFNRQTIGVDPEFTQNLGGASGKNHWPACEYQSRQITIG